MGSAGKSGGLTMLESMVTSHDINFVKQPAIGMCGVLAWIQLEVHDGGWIWLKQYSCLVLRPKLGVYHLHSENHEF